MKKIRLPGWAAKWTRRFLRVFGLLFLALIVMELAYRNQWIDTYSGALEGLNPPGELEKEGRTVLVLGDSFSAARDSWVETLREKLPDHRIINSSIAGTGVVQASIVAPRRFARFKPDVLIYQVYAGNDLYDYRYPIHWARVNFFRNVYWWWAHRFRSIGWLNHAMGQVRGGPTPDELLPGFQAPFDPAKYTAREKMIFRAEPYILEHQAFLLGRHASDMQGYLRRLDEILALCAAHGTEAWIVVLPHCAMVDPQYEANMQRLGAEFSYEWNPSNSNYPFATAIGGHAGTKARVLNPLPAMQAAEGAGQRLFYNNDPHLNAEGHRFLGNWIWNAMRELPSVP